MRQAAEAISAVPDVSTDWPSLIDSWAVRFLHEMDYTREAANAQLFRCASGQLQLLLQQEAAVPANWAQYGNREAQLKAAQKAAVEADSWANASQSLCLHEC